MLSFYQSQSLKINSSIKLLFISILLASSVGQLSAQEDDVNKVFTAFQNYSSQYREVAYCHLNKSTYIKGEMLGFSAYVLNKDFKAPSQFAKNLYCVITDSEDKVVKSKLVKVSDGFANDVFKIDGLFTSGKYTFKAYTNWMKNFDERNAFVESFRVIDTKNENLIVSNQDDSVLDVQFLPEGGHFVDMVKTNVGVTLKNNRGYGIADVNADVFDESDTYITSFKTNSLGISRFLLQPELNNKYRVEFNYLNKAHSYYIENIEAKGISINVNESMGKVAVALNTNAKTFEDIGDNMYTLVIHNGKIIKAIDILFSEEQVIKLIDYEQLFPGVNVFTLFDSNNKPIVERSFFNYNGINFIESKESITRKVNDSLLITVPLILAKKYQKANISVSMLPEETKSYERHHNIISYNYLQPYVKGYIENAGYYFTKINRRTKYDLDNLLITQGWSSYNWQKIFNNNITDAFAYEDGIIVTTNKNSDQPKKYILYPLEQNDGFIVELSGSDKSFVKSGFYPVGSESLKLGAMNIDGKVNKPNVFMQFSPSKIPNFSNQLDILNPKGSILSNSHSNTSFNLNDIKEIQLLEEVLVETERDIRIKKLKNNPGSTIDVFDDKRRASNITLPNYINGNVSGYIAHEQGGSLIINSITNTSLMNPTQSPQVYLDDLPLGTFEALINFDMATVDYITVNRHGHGGGFLGVGGVIKIYRLKKFHSDEKNDFIGSYKFPLTFSETKKFFTPKYDVYDDEFFTDYGVIGWKPNCKIDSNGNLNFTVYYPGNKNIKLFIEGITGNGEIISNSEVIKINNRISN